ncbi:MAG: single-stranded DNA-binding protein [Candidatus Cloacimonetes bacterium]|nr:single-stranded DNA-binding protein [Candidatus Cloacimonadota bacterium]
MAGELRLPRINNVVLSGRLTRDVELRYTPGGTPVAKLSLAFDRNYQKDGEWQQETSYIDVVVWSKRGEQCAENLHKGSPVIVEGYIRTRSYSDSSGQNRKITEINANKISFLEKSGTGADESDTEDLKVSTKTTTDEITDDDVPF